MLVNAKSLKGYALDSLDGRIGSVEEFYFDDRHWAVRYLVADTAAWLPGREVLLSPHALASVDTEKRHIRVELTRAEIEAAPSPEKHRPVSMQFEMDYYGYYGWPRYWSGPHMWGSYPYLVRDRRKPLSGAVSEPKQDLHLRSTRHVAGYHVEAQDGAIGHIEDFIIDDSVWAIRYLVVDTRDWWPGKRVLVSTRWVENVGWAESKVRVNLTRGAVKEAPEYRGESPLTRDYEDALHRFHRRAGYWADEAVFRR